MAADDAQRRAVNVIRGLAMDAVQRANSGHPGTPMALAPLAHVLFTRVMTYDAGDGEWFDRDRFVLSAGHASMLIYSMLYLTGLGLELGDLEEFRQYGSKTPGHPEKGHTKSIEVTTGPLGQGFGNAVGIALAERHLRERFGSEVCDHHVFGICSDGDLEEGVSHEAASFAGHFGLGRLVFVYDDNHISIDGRTEVTFTDDTPARFRAYGWHVVELGEVAEDLDALERGLREGMAEESRPSLLVLRSHIGYPSPKVQDTADAHGNPLGADEVARVKEILGLPQDDFWVPDDVLAFYREAGRRGAPERAAWEARRTAWAAARPERAEELDACLAQRGLPGWEQKLPRWEPGTQIATRVASGEVLAAVFDVVPGLVGGAADLMGNTGTKVKGAEIISTGDASRRLIPFGVREHGMAAAANGMATSATLPFVGTFFVFSDYMRPSVRLAAMARLKVAFVWTHDSVGLGEDGPTHQPIEHLASLRAMPGLRLIRPADPNEVAAAWRVHIDGEGPTGIVLTRQAVPVLPGTADHAAEGVAKGAYVLAATDGEPEIVLVGTGSEVAVCMDARDLLAADGVAARVVSMPSWDLFDAQDAGYQVSVLPPTVPTLAVEAAAGLGWSRYADDVVSIERFGESAPAKVVLANFGYTPENVANRALALLGSRRNETP